jgi:spore maturation protein CgeB
VNRRCEGEQNTELYNSGLIAFQYARWRELTRRVFEAAACGCCVVTNRLPPQLGLEQLFVDGESIVLYANGWQLMLRLVGLLRDPQRAARIGANGQAAVLQAHTHQARVHQLIALVADLAPRQGAG